jgi:hypothetical protein
MLESRRGRRLHRHTAAGALIALLAIAAMAVAPAAPAWGGGFGCCQCDCSGDPVCADGPENTCATFCMESNCTVGSYTEATLCSIVPACAAAAGTTGVPALGSLGLIAAALAVFALGVGRLRRHQR